MNLVSMVFVKGLHDFSNDATFASSFSVGEFIKTLIEDNKTNDVIVFRIYLMLIQDFFIILMVNWIFFYCTPSLGGR